MVLRGQRTLEFRDVAAQPFAHFAAQLLVDALGARQQRAVLDAVARMDLEFGQGLQALGDLLRRSAGPDCLR
jgi:hypothetical protein